MHDQRIQTGVDAARGAPMTGVLRSLVRRWYVAVPCLLAAAALYLWFSGAGTVYQSVAKVTFVSPGEAAISTTDTAQTQSLVAFAAMIETEIDHGRSTLRFASPSATIFGAGVRKGYRIQVPNEGGQWNYYFPHPELSIEVVGPSPEWVRDTRSRLISKIDSLSRQDQQVRGVAPERQIRPVASDLNVAQVGATRLTRAIGGTILGVVGLASAVTVAMKADLFLLGRRRRGNKQSRTDARAPMRRDSGRSRGL